MSAHQITPKIAALLVEFLTLKNITRSGWARVGIPPVAQETVAAHSFGSGVIAIILGEIEGGDIDVGRVAILAILHDAGETRTGDIALLLRDILEERGLPKSQVDQRAEELQRQGLPEWLQGFLREILEEFRNKETLEAKIAEDAQLIDMGIQALWYQRQGYPTRDFFQIESQLMTDAGKTLWRLIQADPNIFTAWFSRQG